MFLRVEEKAALSKLPNEVNIWYPNQRLLRKESYSIKHLRNIHPKSSGRHQKAVFSSTLKGSCSMTRVTIPRRQGWLNTMQISAMQLKIEKYMIISIVTRLYLVSLTFTYNFNSQSQTPWRLCLKCPQSNQKLGKVENFSLRPDTR